MNEFAFRTSGTTGEPKTVVHSQEAMERNARAFNKAVGLGPNTIMYHCLPLEHMAGCLNTQLCPKLAGGRIAWGEKFSAQTASGFWDQLIASGANTVWITPTIAAMLLRLERSGQAAERGFQLDNVFCGTAPLPKSIRDAWLKTYTIPLQESYGTSEHMLVSVQSWEDARTEHNVGRPIPGVEVEIRDNSEIFVNGTPTGDQGELKDGKLTITGRLKDLIIRGGVNVSPVQVEETVRQVDGVRDAAAVGQKDDFWGERTVVFAETITPLEVREVITANIWLSCRKNLPKSHWPDVIVTVDTLPRNAMGKVVKSELLKYIR